MKFQRIPRSLKQTGKEVPIHDRKEKHDNS